MFVAATRRLMSADARFARSRFWRIAVALCFCVRPAVAISAEDVPDLRACSFQQVTPGETTAAEVLERLGQPTEESEADGSRALVYVQEPFERIEIVLVRDQVASVVLHLTEPASPRQIAKELGLESFGSTPITSETGQVLGRGYPERGVLLNFASDSSASKVKQLVLEPVGAELFVLRVKHDTQHRYQQNLTDLDIALQLDPSHAEALSLRASLLCSMRDYEDALAAAEQALQLAPAEPKYLVQRAELLAKLDRDDEAVSSAKGVATDPSGDPLLKARAECVLGDVQAKGATRDFVRAIEHHLAAIKLASPLASDRVVATRREAKSVLLDAFVAAARDVAAGQWQQREETVAKWLGGARDIADAAIQQDEGDEWLKLRVHLASLAVHAEMQSSVAPAQLLASVDREVKRLNETSGDELFQETLKWGQARALYDAASIEHGREGKLKAFDYATRAAELIAPLTPNKSLSPSDQYFVGQLYFFVGSSHAVVHSNHVEAVRWYERARKYLSDSLPPSAAGDLGRHGERLVSMGASYWEAGQRNEGLDLTRRGLELMKQAAKQGLIHEDKLALPYGNLAAMYKSSGKSDEARNFAEIASRLGRTLPAGTTRR